MDNNQTHIDQLVRDKFEQFQPTPPGHVWTGIEQGLADQEKPVFVFQYAKQFIAAAVLVFLALVFWYVFPVSEMDQIGEIETLNEAEQLESESIVYPEEQGSQEMQTEIKPAVEPTIDDLDNEIVADNNGAKNISSGTVVENNHPNNAKDQLKSIDGNDGSLYALSHLDSKSYSSVQLSDTKNEFSEINNDIFAYLKKGESAATEASIASESGIKHFKNYWNIGLYFTPEIILNNFDSVTIMNTYSLNIEPSWYFNKHWFMRFGAGISYVRDRGFAEVDYTSNDYLGSYDSVLYVTFETIDNELHRIYHTQEVEIWDSVRHFVISEVTNEYYFLQIPLMFGYHNSTDKFKWYFYTGPAMNISISKQIEDPKSSIEHIKIIDLENNLPQRVDYSLQLWVGAGIDFRIGQRLSLAFEPNYRYYFKPVYKESNYKTALSGLGLRFGLVYKLNE
ncbi:MAG: hypothetical protein DRI89_00935 [Bacteroidetes bacterium]|nr:MAG: hypothetical protein DRI89_00935 [Bacteroidota bacterium]